MLRDAWAITIYKSAVEGLTTEEMEDLRPTFEEQAAAIPEQVEITGEQISGNNAIVYVKVPSGPDATQITSKPTNLINSGGVWIIGSEADQAIVKKAGRRYFLDALIEGIRRREPAQTLLAVHFIHQDTTVVRRWKA